MKVFFKILATIIFCMIWGSIQRGCQDATSEGSGSGYVIGNVIGLVLLFVGIYAIWKFNFEDNGIPKSEMANKSEISNLENNLKATENGLKNKEKEVVLNSVVMAKNLLKKSSIHSKQNSLEILDEIQTIWETYSNPQTVFTFNETIAIIEKVIVQIKNNNLSQAKNYWYQSVKYIKLKNIGGYIKKSNSTYYDMLIFESNNVCHKVSINKKHESLYGITTFKMQINDNMLLMGNTGNYKFNTEKNEILIKFNLDKQHEQTFRCKLRADGTLVVNVFFKEEHSNDIKKDIREYYFDSNFKHKFLLK